MFDQLIPRIPLTEAADFFYRVKHAGWDEPPDMAGALEGQFAAPVEQVIAQITTVITAKFQIMVAYYTFAESMRDLAQHPIGEVFHEHAGHELEAAEYYLKRAAVLGGAIHLNPIEPPPASTDPIHIIQTMIRAEQEAIANQRQLRQLVGDDNPMRIEIEEKMVQDQHHLDELWQMLPSELHGEAGAEVAPAEAAPVAVEAPAAAKTASDKHTDQELRETGRQRAVTQLASEAHREKGRRGERFGGLAGSAVGTAGGAAIGKHLGGTKGAIGGAALGYMLGGKAGKELGTERDLKKNAAAMRFKLASIKLGFGPDVGTYMAANQAGQKAQEQGEADFYREKVRSMEQASGASQQQIADMQAQLQQLQEQQSQSGAAIQAASQEAVSARDDALAQTQAAANMRIGYQKLRQQIIDSASQDPEAMAAAGGGLPGDLPPGAGNGIAPAMQPGMPAATPEAVAPGAVPAEAGGPGAPGAVQNASGVQPGPNPTAAATSQKSASVKQSAPQFLLHAIYRGDVAEAKKGRKALIAQGAKDYDIKAHDEYIKAHSGVKQANQLGALVGGVGGGALGAFHGLRPGRELGERQRALNSATKNYDGTMPAAMEHAKALAALEEAKSVRSSPLKHGLVGGLRGAALGGALGAGLQQLSGNLSEVARLRH